MNDMKLMKIAYMTCFFLSGIFAILMVLTMIQSIPAAAVLALCWTVVMIVLGLSAKRRYNRMDKES